MKGRKTRFGEFLVEQIKKANLTQEAFYKELKIAKPYFYDMLKNKPPGYEKQNEMLKVLNITDNKIKIEFYNLAAADRNEVPADIFEYLSKENNYEKIREQIYTDKNFMTTNKNDSQTELIEKEIER